MLENIYVRTKLNNRMILCKIYFTIGINCVYLDRMKDGWQIVTNKELENRLIDYAWKKWDL